MVNLPDYRFDPVAYEREELARPDEMDMIDGLAKQVMKAADDRKSARVLDLCCGTGLPTIRYYKHKNIASIVGVDNCLPYLKFARERFADDNRVSLEEGDAVTIDLPKGSWDIIAMCSAYHHIEDSRKLTFLKKVRDLLSVRGVAIIGENILPPYVRGDNASYQNAVRIFYESVLATADAASEVPPDVRGLIQRVAQYGYDGDYEYKTDIATFLDFLRSAGLRICHTEKVWPHIGPLCHTTGGNYVFVVERS
ncbi:class I SAM-dependent methyltransferase [Brucella intermedia]|uniref:class I SAM-dependent methyltransferase n=1 Tax=Brucella intermedia TaxID=94625 RepID=UPI00236255C6|nr:class I SAM-dependent methyltransferase [Brucella intermedia]